MLEFLYSRSSTFGSVYEAKYQIRHLIKNNFLYNSLLLDYYLYICGVKVYYWTILDDIYMLADALIQITIRPPFCSIPDPFLASPLFFKFLN